MRLEIAVERWPLAQPFRISRGVKTEAEVVVTILVADRLAGRGETVPYPRYGETVAGVVAELRGIEAALSDGLDRGRLEALLPAGAARAALDCALWDLEAKRSGVPAWRTAGLTEPGPLLTAYTISLDTPAAMGVAAAAASDRPLLKLKLGGPDDVACVAAVRAAAPNARLIADANEGWSLETLTRLAPELAALGVEMIEQPLPAAEDAGLAAYRGPIPLVADESCHDRDGLADVARRYQGINIKLGKTGGLTEALRLRDAAQAIGLRLMVGCQVCTSLAIAPPALVAADADWVDLDGPLLLRQDRQPGLRFEGSWLQPAEPGLWG